MDALCAPKVALYGFAFFCIKFSIYAILLWMPIFLHTTRHYENHEIANLLTVYELTTLTGTVILGPLTDITYGKRSPIAVVSIALASLAAFILTFLSDSMSHVGLTVTMGFLGFFLGSIYHIVNITCCADLGKEQRGKKATATIAGIIDGFGSSGTGTGMFCLGIFIDAWGYQYGFLFVVSCVITLTLVPLSFILVKDLAEIRAIRARSEREREI